MNIGFTFSNYWFIITKPYKALCIILGILNIKHYVSGWTLFPSLSDWFSLCRYFWFKKT